MIVACWWQCLPREYAHQLWKLSWMAPWTGAVYPANKEHSTAGSLLSPFQEALLLNNRKMPPASAERQAGFDGDLWSVHVSASSLRPCSVLQHLPISPAWGDILIEATDSVSLMQPSWDIIRGKAVPFRWSTLLLGEETETDNICFSLDFFYQVSDAEMCSSNFSFALLQLHRHPLSKCAPRGAEASGSGLGDTYPAWA